MFWFLCSIKKAVIHLGFRFNVRFELHKTERYGWVIRNRCWTNSRVMNNFPLHDEIRQWHLLHNFFTFLNCVITKIRTFSNGIPFVSTEFNQFVVCTFFGLYEVLLGHQEKCVRLSVYALTRVNQIQISEYFLSLNDNLLLRKLKWRSQSNRSRGMVSFYEC